MTYKIVWAPKSEKMLGKLEKRTILRIVKKMCEVAESPYDFIEKIKAENGYKVRAGDYRVFIDLDKDKKELHVLTIRHRRHAYEK